MFTEITKPEIVVKRDGVFSDEIDADFRKLFEDLSDLEFDLALV